MGICQHGSHSSTWSSVKETCLQKIGFIHVFQCSGVFSDRCGKCFKPHGSALKIQDQGLENAAVCFIKAILIYFQKIQCEAGNIVGDHTIILHLGEITYSLQKTVGQTGGFLWNAWRSRQLHWVRFPRQAPERNVE